jgi:uncharacterized repeat protein (TIGR02543 family)
MKNTFKIIGIIAIVAVIGFGSAACEQPTNEPAKVAVTGVTLNKTALSLTVGQEETLTATVTPPNATNKAVSWKSSDTGKATVANGVVKAVAVGTAIITVTTTDGNKTEECTVTVSRSPEKIEVTKQPTKTKFATGEQLDITGLEVTATYSGGDTEKVTITLENITGFNPNTEGEQTLTITYGGKTTTFKVTVIGVSKIEVTKQPTKTKFAPGEPLDITGLEVTATYSDNSTETVTITAGHITGFNPNTTGEQTLTITYGGKTATFKVTVIGLSKIEVTKQPTKTRYAVGEQLDLTGLEVTATYSDTTTETVTITAEHITGFSSATVGTKTLTVTYGGRTTTFTVTVAAVYTVTFNPNGGNWSGDTDNKTVEVEPNTTVAKPDDPQKDGLVFNGWYRDDNTFNNQWNFSTNTVTGNINLYARWVSQNDIDFGTGASIANTFDVDSTTQWNNAVNFISGGGNDKNYIINVTADFTVTGRTTDSFGVASGIKVAIRGEGRTLTLSGNGRILQIAANQTVILRDVVLKGRGLSVNNDTYLVSVSGNFIMNGGEISGNRNYYSTTGSGDATRRGSGVSIDNGNFTMNNGKISGNNIYVNTGISTLANAYGAGVSLNGGTFIMNGGEISSNQTYGYSDWQCRSFGGGVYISEGTFTMNGGKISGNTASGNYGNCGGGGVCVEGANSTFTMHGGKITGNTSSDNYGGLGGGVYVSKATFRIVTGTIYGSNEADTSLRNTPNTLYMRVEGGSTSVQYGKFDGDEWKGTDLPFTSDNTYTRYTEDTIKVKDGVLQQ